MADKWHESNMKRMLEHRMGWNVSEPRCPFQVCTCHRISNTDRAVVFLIHKEEAMLLYDELGIYPSDALVTKLRMLE